MDERSIITGILALGLNQEETADRLFKMARLLERSAFMNGIYIGAQEPGITHDAAVAASEKSYPIERNRK